MTNITPEQCRAARAWLGWSQIELAQKADVGITTIKELEDGSRVNMRRLTMKAIVGALEAAGIEFGYAIDAPCDRPLAYVSGPGRRGLP